MDHGKGFRENTEALVGQHRTLYDKVEENRPHVACPACGTVGPVCTGSMHGLLKWVCKNCQEQWISEAL